MNQVRKQVLPRFVLCLSILCLVGFPVGCGNQPPKARVAPLATPPSLNGIGFEDVTSTSGIKFVWPQQPRPMRNLEAFGSGCAFLDYDDDGWQDILLVAQPYPRLYHNLRNGRFEDVSSRLGLAGIKGYWTGCAVGDYDGDGRLDVLLTGYHCLKLLKNDSQKGFVDTTVSAGLDPTNRGHWGSSAGFMDLGGKGRMDLVLLNYVIFGPGEQQYCSPLPGVKTGCPPSTYRPEFGEMWENVGNGRFRDVTNASGMKQTHGKALVVAFADPGEQGKMDFYVGNDGTPAELMHNQGGMRFRNIGVEGGVAYGSLDHAIAAMGADWGDYDRDGLPDLIVTAFSDESFALFRNAGHSTFEQVNDMVGLSVPTFKPLGFGTKWLDIDNDGWLDVVFASGHVYDAINKTDPQSTFRQQLMLFHNENGDQNRRTFRDLIPLMDSALRRPILGRGLATGDYDNDGKIDLLVVDYEGAPLLLHNTSTTPNHWISLELRMEGKNQLAYGAQVRARSGQQVWIGQVSPASSYLSSSDPRIHWGLGSLTKLDEVAIRWPDGRKEVLRDVPTDHFLQVTQGHGWKERKTN